MASICLDHQHSGCQAAHQLEALCTLCLANAVICVEMCFKKGLLPAADQAVSAGGGGLQRLVTALDLLWEGPPDLAGLRLLICGRTALDSQGNLLLDGQQSAEEWADFLGGVDLQYARGKKETTAALRQLESNVAAAVGVRMLFTAAPHLMTHEYRYSASAAVAGCGYRTGIHHICNHRRTKHVFDARSAPPCCGEIPFLQLDCWRLIVELAGRCLIFYLHVQAALPSAASICKLLVRQAAMGHCHQQCGLGMLGGPARQLFNILCITIGTVRSFWWMCWCCGVAGRQAGSSNPPSSYTSIRAGA